MSKDVVVTYNAKPSPQKEQIAPKVILYRITVSLKPNVQAVAQVTCPFSIPFPSFTIMSEDETAKGSLLSIAGNTIRIGVMGTMETSAIVFLKVQDGSNMIVVPQ